MPVTYERATQLGPLVEERIELIEEEPGHRIVRKDLYFPGLVLGVVVPSDDPNRYMVSGAHITDRRWKSLAPFAVGQTLQSARKLLGRPAASDRDLKATYGTESSSITFETSGGILRGIVYTCYTG